MEMWELTTNIVLILSFIAVGIFAVLGLIQWIKRKSLKKVDKQLLWMPLPLALMAVTYAVFDKILPKFVDFMPTRPNGSGEPCFPSTHVMIVATIFFTTTIILPKYIKNKAVRIVLELLMIVGLALTCTGRVIAELHTAIDVIGAIAFAFVFSEIYLQVIKSKKKSKK